MVRRRAGGGGDRRLMGCAALRPLAALLALRRVGELLALARARPRQLVVVGVGTAAYQGLYFVSVTQVGVAVSTVVSLGLAPVLLTVAEAVRDRRAPATSRLVVLGAALATSARRCPNPLQPPRGMPTATRFPDIQQPVGTRAGQQTVRPAGYNSRLCPGEPQSRPGAHPDAGRYPAADRRRTRAATATTKPAAER